MSVNKYRPHVIILPEDDCDSEIAHGFRQELDPDSLWQVHIERIARGWHHVVETFEMDHVSYLRRYPEGFVVLVIDFDGDAGRRAEVQQKIPHDLAPRVFVLGSLKEPEDLKADLGSPERIGERVARECRENRHDIWRHRFLEHHYDEVQRLGSVMRPILFP